MSIHHVSFNKTAKLLLVVLLYHLLLGCAREPDKIQITPDSRILAFGDSLTKGTGTSVNNSYPSHLERMLGVTVINAGLPGELSKDGIERLITLLKVNTPDVVILCHGGNDILRKYPVAQLENNLREMIELTQSYGAELILVGVPKPSITLKTLEVYEVLSKEYGLVSEQQILGDLLKKPAFKSDRVHLNDLGYEKLAMAIAQKIEVVDN